MVSNLFMQVFKKLYPEVIMTPTDMQRYIVESHDHIKAFFYMNAEHCEHFVPHRKKGRRVCGAEENKGGVCLLESCPLPRIHNKEHHDA